MNTSRQNVDSSELYERRVGGHKLYSHAVVAPVGRYVFISGQLARDAQGNVVGPGDMRAQLRQVGENLKAALRAAGASLESVVKITTYATDLDEFFKHVDVRAEYFGTALPASTAVQVARLSHPDFLVEIEAVAVVPAT
jgi:2-iminobutanoate/2-iminopropanoate deaminase